MEFTTVSGIAWNDTWAHSHVAMKHTLSSDASIAICSGGGIGRPSTFVVVKLRDGISSVAGSKTRLTLLSPSGLTSPRPVPRDASYANIG